MLVDLYIFSLTFSIITIERSSYWQWMMIYQGKREIHKVHELCFFLGISVVH